MTALPRDDDWTGEQYAAWFEAQPYKDRQPQPVTTIELPGEPMPAARWKTTSGDGKQFKRYMKQKKDFREWAGYQMTGQWYFEDGERLAVELRIRRKDNRTADVDNLFKAVTDPLNGIVYADDRQIDEAHIYVTRGVGLERAGVTVKVWARTQASVQPARPQRRRLRQYASNRHLCVGE